MKNQTINRAEAYSVEQFQCGSCGREFESKIITWVDVSRMPQVRQSLFRWDFNGVECTHCGCRRLSGTPFFYEDFEEGLLIAVFPGIPDKRGELERGIREKYGYYPVLGFFYDMTQIWLLIYFQDHYKMSKEGYDPSKGELGAGRLRKMLRFLKEDPLMIDIREKLTESFFGSDPNDELADILGQAIYTLEEMQPWPLDNRCACGADLAAEFKCCGKRIDLDGHRPLLSRKYIIYCPTCKGAISGITCEACGRAYTWKLGLVDSGGAGKKSARDARPRLPLNAEHRP